MQENYEKYRNKIDREMIFASLDPENMTPEQERLYNKNLAILNCSNDINSM